jgi:hypothetical protein
MEVPFEGGGVLRVDGGAVEITPAIRIPAAALTECSVEAPRKLFGRRGDGGTVAVALTWRDQFDRKIRAKLTCRLTPEQGEALGAELDRARQVPAASIQPDAFEPCPAGWVLEVTGDQGPVRFDGEVLALQASTGPRRILPAQLEAVGVHPPRNDKGQLGFWAQYSAGGERGVVGSQVSVSEAVDLARLVSAVEAARPAAGRM